MQKIISRKDVEYTAKLARIELTEDEKARFEEQLERILEYVDKLKKLNTDNIAPTSHPIEVDNVWRPDEAKPFQDIPAVLKNAPDREETFYRVKKVIE